MPEKDSQSDTNPSAGQHQPKHRGNSDHQTMTTDVPYGSNEVRLSLRQWLVVALLVCGCLVLVPRVWERLEPFEPSSDYRIPYVLSDDYWLYNRWMEDIVAQNRIPIIGDSVVWGEYVTPEESLSQFLNQRAGGERFANAGLNGSHPLALEGLVDQLAGRVRNRRVILHCNLLWMSSPERDLQIDMNMSFNHPRLVPQLVRLIPSYRVPPDERLGNIVDRQLAFRQWVHHLRIAHFENLDLHSWSLEHPYRSPVSVIEWGLPAPDRVPRHDSASWFERGIERQDFPWVGPSTSLQFQGFQRMLLTLQRRENHVFVIVGPFNEHLPTDESLERYNVMKQYVRDWLTEQQVPHLMATVIESEGYGDASHPLAIGYDQLAKQIFEDAEFQSWFSTQTRQFRR